MREQGGRQEHHRAYTAVRRERVHGDAESVALGESPDDGEAEAGRVAEPGDVHRVCAGEQFGGVRGRLAVHADPGVVDHHAGAVVHRLDGDLDGRARLRVTCRVVEQFGDREHHRFDRPAPHGDVDLAVDADAPVVADAGGGAAYDLDERGGGALTAGPRAAQHCDGLGTAAELGVGVVDFEQVAQHAGVVVPVLHLGDGHLLFVGQGLDGAHRRLQGGLRRLVCAQPGVLDGAGEPLHNSVEALRELRVGEPGVEQTDGRELLVGRVLQGRQPGGDEVPQFLLPCPKAVPQFGVPSALPRADAAFAHQQHGHGEQAHGQAPDHRLRYLFRHQVLTASGGRRAHDGSGASASALVRARKEVAVGRRHVRGTCRSRPARLRRRPITLGRVPETDCWSLT
ncbi:hypothetical protein OHO27_00590 [Streptomyces sp. NBC_00443]